MNIEQLNFKSEEEEVFPECDEIQNRLEIREIIRSLMREMDVLDDKAMPD